MNSVLAGEGIRVFLIFLELKDGIYVPLFTMRLTLNYSLLAPNLAKVTAVVGLWGWTAVSLAVGSLIMFYKCSR